MDINVQVGQEVAVRSGYGHHDYAFGYVVKRVTPKSGEIVVVRGESEYRFDRQGWQMKSSIGYRSQIEPDVAKARAAMDYKAKAIAASNAIQAVYNSHGGRGAIWSWGKQSLADEVARLEKLVAEARSAVDALPDSVP